MGEKPSMGKPHAAWKKVNAIEFKESKENQRKNQHSKQEHSFQEQGATGG